MISIESANKQYGSKVILNNFSLSLKKGKSYGLLGGNGAGKSTLIKSIMGLVHLDFGSIQTEGRLSFLPEQAYLSENLSARQLVTLACQIQSCPYSDVEILLNEVGLDQASWDKKISKYSKGMRQRTSVAYSLAGKPDWLILDEPMSGLDVMGRMMMRDIIQKRRSEGVGILMCSHVVTDMVKLCDSVFIVAEGEVRQTMDIVDESMDEVTQLEESLKQWGSHETLA